MDKKASTNPLQNPYVILLSLGVCMAFTQNYLISHKFPDYHSDWIFFLPVYVTFAHLLLFYFFNKNPEQKQPILMIGSAVRIFAYILPTFIFIYLTDEKKIRIFFIILIFIYYFAFSLTDSILKIRQIKKD